MEHQKKNQCNKQTWVKAKNIMEDIIRMRFCSIHSSPAWTQPFSLIIFDTSKLYNSNEQNKKEYI